MPNIRVYLESRILAVHAGAVRGTVARLRETLGRTMHASPEACHILLVPALGDEVQAECYVDMNYRPSALRSREAVTSACAACAQVLTDAFGVRVRIRASEQDSDRLVSLG